MLCKIRKNWAHPSMNLGVGEGRNPDAVHAAEITTAKTFIVGETAARAAE